jgi:MFS family permease
VPQEEEIRGSSNGAARRGFTASGSSPASARLTTHPLPAPAADVGTPTAQERGDGQPDRIGDTPPQVRRASNGPVPSLPAANGPTPPPVASNGATPVLPAPSPPVHDSPASGHDSPAPSEDQEPRISLSGPTSNLRLLDAQQGRHRRPPERQASYREVFAVGEFRALWSAQVLSYVGDQFAQVAIAILVYGRTGSAFLTALAYALTYLPPIIGGPLLSGLADLFPRRRIMISCDLIRACLVGGMAIPGVPFAVLCVLLFGTVLLGSPFSSARSALLPEVLPGDKYVLGSAIGNITFQASQIIGFVAGAAVVTALDPSRTLAVDALTFLVSALIVAAWVRRRAAPVGEHSKGLSLWAMTRDGAKLVFGNPLLRSLVLFGWLAGFYVIPEGLAAPYAHALHGDTLDVGLMMAAMPVGMVIGAFTVGRLAKPSTRMRLMGWLAMISCAPLLGSVANPPLWVVLTLLALSGVGGAYQLAAASAFVQSVPNAGRASAFGLAQSGLLAVQGLGILIGGAAAQAIGPHQVVALTGLLGLTTATLLAMGWTHRRGEMIASVRARAEAAEAD